MNHRLLAHLHSHTHRERHAQAERCMCTKIPHMFTDMDTRRCTHRNGHTLGSTDTHTHTHESIHAATELTPHTHQNRASIPRNSLTFRVKPYPVQNKCLLTSAPPTKPVQCCDCPGAQCETFSGAEAILAFITHTGWPKLYNRTTSL